VGRVKKGWDREGKVRASLRRAVMTATKGLEEKENLIRNVERVIASIDTEEWEQGTGQGDGADHRNGTVIQLRSIIQVRAAIMPITPA